MNGVSKIVTPLLVAAFSILGTLIVVQIAWGRDLSETQSRVLDHGQRITRIEGVLDEKLVRVFEALGRLEGKVDELSRARKGG